MHCIIPFRKTDTSMKVIKMLLALKDVDLNKRNWFGHTALDIAEYAADLEVVNMIKKKVGSQGRSRRDSEILELSSESCVAS